MLLLTQHGARPVSPVDGFGHHLVTIDQKFTGLPLQESRIEGDATPARIQIGDQSFDPVSLAKHLTHISQLTAANRRLVQKTTHPAEIDKQAIGLDRHHLTFHQLADLQVLK